MKREDLKPASAHPKITKKVSYKNVSDSCLAQFQACETKEFWNMAVPRAAISEADLASFIPLHPQLQQEVEQPEPEERLFNHIVSDNVLIRPKNLSESVRHFLNQKPKGNSDAILALREVRELQAGAPSSRRSKEPEVIEPCAWKFYDGQIVKKVQAGLLIDIKAKSLGLLRWRWVRGVPKTLQKVGGFLGNLQVSKMDQKDHRFILKLHTIGFDHDTIEETKYTDIYSCVHCWSQLPGAPPYSRQAPPKAEDFAAPVAKPPLAPLSGRLANGKHGPRQTRARGGRRSRG